MKIRKLAWVMALVAITLPSMAQKKTTASKTAEKPKTETSSTSKEEKKGTFYGTIIYQEMASKAVSQRKLGDPSDKDIKFNVADPITNHKTPLIYSFGENLSVCVMFGMGDILDYKRGYYTRTVRIEDDQPLRGFKMSLDELSKTDKWYSNLSNLMALEKENKAKELEKALNKLYKRHTDTKKILNIEVTRYERISDGSIFWVAEGIDLDTWCAPFWGIKHPVLEFNYNFYTPGSEGLKMNVIATRIEKSKDAHEIIGQLYGFEPVPMNVFDDMTRIVVDKYRK